MKKGVLSMLCGRRPSSEVFLQRRRRAPVVGGLDTDEVAAIVGKKRGTVRVLQHRALKRLAALLVEEGRTSVTR